ncbi:Sec-independent protein translocase protein TatB [Phenylobacterium sp.]|jgi:sec-independent protein translocase protein TatB|uniref:Sec-independent protein translocase protein TatB n=1 Tax=Phenylobacterium sp. TaxID=1871053 RepID=UPI002F3FE43B
MLPEIGASELLVIAVVALIVVGPKDLPMLLRKLGQMLAKLRGMAAEFRASFDEMARQSELDELRREVEAMRRGQAAEMASLHAGEAEVAQTFDEIRQEIHDGMAPQPAYMQSAAAPEPAPAEPAPVVEAAPPKPHKAPRKAAAEPDGGKTTPPKPRARRSGTVA